MPGFGKSGYFVKLSTSVQSEQKILAPQSTYCTVVQYPKSQAVIHDHRA